MESNKIITKVTEPTEWVNPIVTVRKPSGALRICLDPLELNKAIRREHYSIPTPGEIVAKLHGSKYFSTLDATSGFLQIPLDDFRYAIGALQVSASTIRNQISTVSVPSNNCGNVP